MKCFILAAALTALVAADQSHHQVIKVGNAPSVSVSVHKPHGAHHASVVSQPHAAPQSVHGYGYHNEKPVAAVHAPAAVPGYTQGPYHAPSPYHAPVVHHAASPYHAAPVHHAAAPYHAAPVHHVAPVYHAAPAPAYHTPAPYHAPVVHHAPAAPYHAPVVHHAPAVIAHAAPAYAHPAPHSAYDKEEPAPYAFEYGVADDYSKAQFTAAETADVNGAVAGSYSVALPDGRTQHVKYSADHYNGYIADVSYEGVPVYPEAAPYHAAPGYHAAAPAYHAAAPAYHA